MLMAEASMDSKCCGCKPFSWCILTQNIQKQYDVQLLLHSSHNVCRGRLTTVATVLAIYSRRFSRFRSERLLLGSCRACKLDSISLANTSNLFSSFREKSDFFSSSTLRVILTLKNTITSRHLNQRRTV